MYKIHNNLQGNPAVIERIFDNAFISMSETNTDYQAYLKWVEEGNTPLPADEVK